MGLNIDANYDEVVVHFDPYTLGILHIKARNSTDGSEQGTLDRFTTHNGNILPGIYNSGPYDPEGEPNGLDIDECIRKVMDRRKNPSEGAALIYKFGEDNEVDVTNIDTSDIPICIYYLSVDPIYTAIVQREGRSLLGLGEDCVVGTLRVRKGNNNE